MQGSDINRRTAATMPRLFYAVDLPDDIKDVIAPVVSSLRDLGRDVRPVGRHGFHLTLLFLGDQPASAIADFAEFGSNAVAPARPCQLALGLPGFFPRVSFLTLKGETETLAVISSVLNDSCADYLEQPETRPFKPHVTLARHKSRIDPRQKERIVELFAPFEGRSWTADELVLFESELTPKGAIYSAVERFRFGG
jgi:2'-5' RNA ligase